MLQNRNIFFISLFTLTPGNHKSKETNVKYKPKKCLDMFYIFFSLHFLTFSIFLDKHCIMYVCKVEIRLCEFPHKISNLIERHGEYETN